MMMKNCLFAVALVNVALFAGCAKGLGGGGGGGITVTVSDGNLAVLYVTQKVTFTAQVTGTTNTAVTWSLSGTACTGTPNPCGTIDPTSGVYQAPAAAPNPGTVTITATSQADNKTTGELTVKVTQITVNVTPTPTNVGQGLVQQFTAVAVPDSAPQTFTWTVTCAQTGAACGSFVQDSTISGLIVYTAPPVPPTGCTSSNCVQVTATSTIDASGIGLAKVTVESSRISGAYTFRFSGYDAAGHPVTVTGSLTFAKSGTFQQGVEDVIINTGAGSIPQHYPVNAATYNPVSNINSANNTNNAGTLTVDATAGGGPLHTYTVVLDSGGDVQMIESDTSGKGSGVMEQATPTKFATVVSLSGSFVFGFTGTDLNGKRVGYVGVLPMDGTGNISGGSIDINDNGGGTNGTAAAVTGTYTMANGIGTMSLLESGKTLGFNLYGVSGQAKATNPLTLYAISTDPLATNPAVSGTVVFQDPGGAPYNNATFKNGNTSVSDLTGVDSTGTNTNVSLTLSSTDGSGNLSGNFDQNNAGTILSVANFAYKYSATGNGRYTVQMLGNPGANPPVPPLPFILYASGANRGFLLDQSSTSVMTGTMTPQLAKDVFSFAPSELPGTYSVATESSGTSGVTPLAANLLLTSPGSKVYNVSGTQYPGSQTVTGAYTLTVTGTGTIVLTAPAATNYVIYAIDTADFLTMDVDKTNTNASIIFAQQ